MGSESVGLRVQRLRARLGLTQADIADFAGRSEKWVWRLENGRAGIDLPTAQRLADGLGVDVGVVLGLAPIPEDLASVNRREFVRAALTSAAGAALIPAVDPLDPEPWERLARVLSHRSRADQATANHLENATVALESLEYQLAPSALIGPVRGHLDEVCRLLEGTHAARLRRQLLSIAGETAATAGWLMWDLERLNDMRAYWRVAIDAAEEAGDRALLAFVLASASFQPSYRENPGERLDQLTGRERHATPRTKAWILATMAEAHALAGNDRACLRTLDRADDVMAQLGDDRTSRRPRYDPFDTTRMLSERGAALVKLGRGREARDVLETALAGLQDQPRMLNSARTSYARALAQQGEVDGAVTAANAALDAAAAMGTAPTLGALGKVVRDLQPWAASPVVQQLDQRLRTIAP